MTIPLLILAVPVIWLLLLLIDRYKPFFFWLFTALYFDPGGYMDGYFDNNIIGSVNFADVFILLVLFVVILKVKSVNKLQFDADTKRLFRAMAVYFLYFIALYAILIPWSFDRMDLLYFFIKNRSFPFAFILLIGIYVFSQEKIENYLVISYYTAGLVLSMLFITEITGTELIVIRRLNRYNNVDWERLILSSHGLYEAVFPLTFLLIISKIKLRIKALPKWLVYYSGLLMLLAEYLSLTRRIMVDILAIIFLGINMIARLGKRSIIKMSWKVGVVSICLVLGVLFAVPKYFDIVTTIYEDIFLLVTTGVDSRGVGNYRISQSGGLINAQELISENFLFGIGYVPLSFQEIQELSRSGDYFGLAVRAAPEVPIYDAVLRLGIVGILLYLPIYILVFRKGVKIYRLIRDNWSFLKETMPAELLVLMYTLLFLVKFVFVRFYYLFGESVGTGLIGFQLVTFAFLFGLSAKVEKAIKKKTLEAQEQLTYDADKLTAVEGVTPK